MPEPTLGLTVVKKKKKKKKKQIDVDKMHSVLTIPKWASATATSLQGRSSVERGAGSGGNTRKHNLLIKEKC
jgi:hypothetical protein